MKEFNNIEGKISFKKGEVFDISLESQAASTGYSWALSSMPNCLNLLDVGHISSTSMIDGGKTRQVFKFAAVEEAEAYLEFSLCRPWEPLKIVEKKIYIVTITGQSQDMESALKSTMGAGRFISGDALKPTVTSEQRPVIPYGVPLSVVEDKDNCYLMYGVPTGVAKNISDCILKYGIPANLVEDNKNCVVKYGTPMGIAVKAEECVLKYGVPVSVAHDPENCILEYGIPTGKAKSSKECVLKYGVPIDRTIGRGGITILYGVPHKLDENVLQLYTSSTPGDIVVAYGIPDVKYGIGVANALLTNDIGNNCLTPMTIAEDKDNCVVKYGIPSGVANNDTDCILKYGAPVKK